MMYAECEGALWRSAITGTMTQHMVIGAVSVGTLPLNGGGQGE
jgi:hypothetical protein